MDDSPHSLTPRTRALAPVSGSDPGTTMRPQNDTACPPRQRACVCPRSAGWEEAATTMVLAVAITWSATSTTTR